MTRGTETRLDGTTLVVRIPMRFQRRGGRKRIVAPDGSDLVRSSKPQPDGTLVKALARAHRWQRLLEQDRYSSIRVLAEAEKVSHGYIVRLLRLTLLAPDIVEMILHGHQPPAITTAWFMREVPACWEQQRATLRQVPSIS
jgi:hypothetical protein